MATFSCHFGGALEAKHSNDVGFRVINRAALTEFWNGNVEQKARHGIYVFALKRKGPGGAVPYYVGKAAKTEFQTETFNARNRQAFTAALFEGGGKPEIHLVSLHHARGSLPLQAINDLETLLIWIARHRNPALLNRRKIDSSPHHLMQLFDGNTIKGVLNSGSGNIHGDAHRFRAMMGL
jgi:hypothetical protein